MNIETVNSGADLGASLAMRADSDAITSTPKFVYHFECVGDDGEVKWTDSFENLVTTVGKNDLIDKYFKGSAYTAAWYLGLKGTGTAVVGDTLASHGAWSEVNPYAGNRPAITFGTTSAGSNTATAVSFACTGSATVAGGFISSVNTGTSGILYSAGDFSASRAVVNGDTLNVTVTVTIT